MALFKFALGWLLWRIRAGLWYVGLGFRLFFAVGLDRDYHPDRDDAARHFKCPIPRAYLRYKPGKRIEHHG